MLRNWEQTRNLFPNFVLVQTAAGFFGCDFARTLTSLRARIPRYIFGRVMRSARFGAIKWVGNKLFIQSVFPCVTHLLWRDLTRPVFPIPIWYFWLECRVTRDLYAKWSWNSSKKATNENHWDRRWFLETLKLRLCLGYGEYWWRDPEKIPKTNGKERKQRNWELEMLQIWDKQLLYSFTVKVVTLNLNQRKVNNRQLML